MFLDPEGIARQTRREDERPGEQPEWGAVCEKLRDHSDPADTRRWLADIGDSVEKLPEIMLRHRVDDDIISRPAGWIREVASGLKAARP